MVYTGHVQNGGVVFPTPLPLPDGTTVEVVAKPASPAENVEPTLTHYELFKDIIGKAEGLPEDFALNHEHYRYGTPKR